jgi:peptidoglycan/xylan/chitin deacetylase (PgdA/CDA1 family)
MRISRACFSAVSGGGARSCLSILIYHRVVPEPDPMRPGDPDVRSFAERLAFLARAFNVLPLGEAVERLRGGTLPPAALAITFDDGYADNLLHALPVLQHFGAPATVFVASGYLDGGRMWNDTVIEAVRGAPGDALDLRDAGLGIHPIRDVAERRRAAESLLAQLKYLPGEARRAATERVAAACPAELPGDLMLTTDQLRELARAGVTIGAHTSTHPILARVDDQEARREIEEGRRQLASRIAQPIELFAYPNGKPGTDFLPRDVELVRQAGFTAAVTTARGVARAAADVMQLPRFTPWDRSSARFGVRMAQNMLGLV